MVKKKITEKDLKNFINQLYDRAFTGVNNDNYISLREYIMEEIENFRGKW